MREVPAEVDLDLGDLVALEGEHLRVAEARAVGPRGLVGHDDLVAMLDIIDDPVVVAAAAARFELKLLAELGFGLDLDRCAAYKTTTFNFAVHRQPQHYTLITERKGAIPPE